MRPHELAVRAISLGSNSSWWASAQFHSTQKFLSQTFSSQPLSRRRSGTSLPSCRRIQMKDERTKNLSVNDPTLPLVRCDSKMTVSRTQINWPSVVGLNASALCIAQICFLAISIATTGCGGSGGASAAASQGCPGTNFPYCMSFVSGSATATPSGFGYNYSGTMVFSFSPDASERHLHFHQFQRKQHVRNRHGHVITSDVCDQRILRGLSVCESHTSERVL
jgi:hypothetical protein